MKTEQEYAADPWYKQPWLLLALVPLVATVIAGTTFLVVSIQSSDGIVKEDHYRKSKGYFKDSTKQQLAFDKKIAANIQNSTLVLIENGKHGLHIQQPQTLLNEIKKFLNT